MKQINHAELEKLVEVHYKKKIPLNVSGTFGIGKSATIKKVCRKLAKEKQKEFVEWRNLERDEKIKFIENEDERRRHFVLIELRGTQLADGSDLRGIINLIKKDARSYVEWDTPMAIFYMTLPYTDGVLFLDERNLAFPVIQSALYSVLYDRSVGDVTFAPDWGIFSAGNLIKDKANIHDAPLPLRDRESEYELMPPTSDDVISYLLANGGDNRIIAYLAHHPLDVHKIDVKSAQKNTTPRGWEQLSVLIKDVDDLEEVGLITAGRISEGIAIQFVAFLKTRQEIDVVKLLDEPNGVEKLSARNDLKYALCSAVAGYLIKNKKNETLDKIFKLSTFMEADFGTLMLKLCISLDEKFFKDSALKSKTYINDVYPTYGKFIL